MKGNRTNRLVLVVLGFLVAASTRDASPADTPAAPRYKLFAFNDLGMHCYDSDFSIFCILPPFNVAHAQVLQMGRRPRLCSGSEVYVFYFGKYDAAGSINRTSGTIMAGPLPVPKTNFWTYAPQIFGVSPARSKVDVGLVNMLGIPGVKGANMPGPNNATRILTYDAGKKWFTAFGIPITDLDDTVAGLLPYPTLRTNPYPLMRFRTARIAVPGSLSELDVVLPVSSEMNCRECHASGKSAATNLGDAASTNPNLDLQTRENVVKLHDSLYQTQLWAHRPMLCASCHYSAALDLLGNGPQGEQKNHRNLSASMHGHHVAPLSPETPAVTCYKCHPGDVTNCLRSVMSSAGISCQDCHGDLTALSGVHALQTGNVRQPWVDLPKCQSCHTGDVLDHPNGDFRLRLAFDPTDRAATPRVSANSRFAENAGKRYRDSSGHGAMACAACHGSPHAEWPARNPDSNDNVAARLLQRHIGPIIECGTCHTSDLPLTTEGPHGMHNVASQAWVGNHADFYEMQGAAACQACHGLLLEGTVLSKTAATRAFTVEGRRVPIAKGTRVSCTLCHEHPFLDD